MSAEPSREAPLRVLHVYSGNLYGGIETFLRTLAEERAKCPEMEPEFALCFEGRLADEIRASGAPLHMLGGVRLSRPWTALRAQVKLRAVLRARRPDVVVLHAAWPHVLFATTIRRARVRLVFYQHDIGRSREWLNVLAGRIEPDLVVSNSRFTAAHAFPRFAAPTEVRSYVLRRPTDCTEACRARAAVREALGASTNDVVLLQASRMQEWKGQLLLAQSLAHLPKDLSWQVWFAGDAQRASETNYVDEVKATVERAGLSDRVRFLGQRKDVADLMNAADIFCQANLAPEPFGIVFVEALSTGLPVVTTKSAGGALEIVDSSCSIVCEPTPAALAEALGSLVVDSDRRTFLGARARERSRTFTDTPRLLRRLSDTLIGSSIV